MRTLRHIVDIAASLLEQGSLTRPEAEALVASTRARVLELFPDGERSYEVIYARRFSRLIAQFTPDP